MTTLPDQLWTDARCVFLRKRRRRLWVLLCDLERFRSRWHPDDFDALSLAVVAANLDTTERRFETDVAELRALGLLAPDSLDLVMCRTSEPVSLPDPVASVSTSRVQRHRERIRDAQNSVSPPLHETPDETPETFHPGESVPTGNASLAKLQAEASSLAKKDSSSSLASALAKPVSGHGDYPNRARPTSEEICRLEAVGWTIPQIEEAIRCVSARPKFRGSARWDLYLQPVLRDKYPSPGQGAMTMVGSVPGGLKEPRTRAVVTVRGSPLVYDAPAAPRGENAEEDAEAIAKWRVWVESHIGDQATA